VRDRSTDPADPADTSDAADTASDIRPHPDKRRSGHEPERSATSPSSPPEPSCSWPSQHHRTSVRDT